MNIRQTSLLITSVLGLAFISVISYKLVGLYNTKIQSIEMQESVEASSVLNKAIIELSLERSVMQVALNLDDPIPQQFKDLLEQQRTISDAGFSEVKQMVRDNDVFTNGEQFMQILTKLQDEIATIRRQADRNLTRSIEDRTELDIKALPLEMKDTILSFSMLPLKLNPANSKISTYLANLKLIQQNAWAIREFGGRERTRLAIATVNEKPFTKEVRGEMIADHKRALEAMSRLLTLSNSNSLDPEMSREVDSVQTAYFENYRSTRESLISAIESGSSLPINFEQFFDKSSVALQAAVDLSYSAGDAMNAYNENRRNASVASFFIFLGLLIAVITICAFQLYYTQIRVSGRILKLADLMDTLSSGNTDVDLEKLHSKDELGQMAKSVEVFKQNAIAKERLEQQSEELAEQFEANVIGIVERVEEASEKMHGMSSDLNIMISNSSRMSSSVADASQSAASDVQTVASAAEEMSSSLREIYGTVTETAERANSCASSASDSQSKLSELQRAVKEIDSVTQAIIAISEQTNLLALNATIEAASAGESGKGFAVVANEVKSLANETKRMTTEISQKIESIKDSAEQTVVSVAEIINEISAVDERTHNLSSTIHEQTSTTEEISRSVASAANQTGEVSRNIVDVQAAASSGADSTSELTDAAAAMIEESKNLKSSVEGFLGKIRSKNS